MTTRSPTIRLGTASPATQPTTTATLVQLESIARRAAASGIDILLLPEAYLGGYPRGSSFGSAIGSRSTQGREEFLSYWNQAVDLGDVVGDGAGGGERWTKRQLAVPDGEGEPNAKRGRGDGTREEIERIASESGVFLVVGCVEKAGGTLYCSVVYVCPRQGAIGKRRKVMPTGTERLIWGQGSPSTLRAVSTTIKGVRVTLAAAICWENYMPLLRQSLYAQNVNLYLAPTADGRDSWLPLMRTAGIEGRCFVVSSNMAVRKESDANGSRVARAREAFQDRKRRSSVFTEEGFEIALPCQETSQRSPKKGVFKETETEIETNGSLPAKSHESNPRRRNSVFTADGFEIALPCQESTPRKPMSVFDDGNEIGLSYDESYYIQERTKSNTHLKENGVAATEWLSRGGSCIISPFGEVLSGPQWEDDDGIIYADVDFSDCIRGRLDLDLAGSYSRNDSFKLSVEGLDLDPLP